ncbi:MAG: hypothetical protein AAFW84_32890, partial [Cyanobacteria bacterium J06635_15]
VRIEQPDGQVVLTNQFQPDTSLASGMIETGEIDTRTTSFGTDATSANTDGGDIFIYSRGDIVVNGDLMSDTSHSNNDAGSGGDIVLSSEFGGILTRGTLDSKASARAGNAGTGGNIMLSTQSGEITTEDSLLSFSSSDSFSFSLIPGGPMMTFPSGDAESGGRIVLSTQFGNITTNDSLVSRTFSDSGIADSGGDIVLFSQFGSIITNEILLSLASTSSGVVDSSGDITLFSQSGDITINDNLQAYSFSGSGEAASGGAIWVSTQLGEIVINGGELNTVSYSFLGNASSGGEIFISAPDGSIQSSNTQLLTISIADSDGTAGAGGAIRLQAREAISGLEMLTLSSTGQSGSVQVQGFGNLIIQGTGVITSAQVTIDIPVPVLTLDPTITLDTSDFGQSGDTFLTSTGDLNLDNVQILSDSNGTNPGGSIFITDTDRVTLNNTALQTDTAGLGPAGSIFVQNVGTLILRNNSVLLAEAQGGVDGGNIDIDANLVIAIPSENSDIIANAVGGTGGRIDIDAIGIYGFTEQSGFTTDELRANGTSDISASSQFGQQGIVNLNSLVVDPSQGLDALEDGFINPEDLISTSCITAATILKVRSSLRGLTVCPSALTMLRPLTFLPRQCRQSRLKRLNPPLGKSVTPS